MKNFDFSFTGGFPFDQDVLDYMQASYKELFDSIAKLGWQDAPAANTPIFITGCQFNSTGTTISDGWFWYNGEVIPLTGGSFTIANIANLKVTITTTTTSFTYNDTSTHPSKIIKSATITDTGSAYNIYNASNFPFTGLIPIGRGESNATHIAVSAVSGKITGDLYWSVDRITRTVKIRGSLSVANGFYSGSYVIGNMSAQPAFLTPFMGIWDNASSITKDSGGIDWLMSVNFFIKTNGDIVINVIEPVSTILYTINTKVPLD